jgi:Zn-dependent protease
VSQHGVFLWLFSTLVRVRFSFLIVMVAMAVMSGRDIPETLTWVTAATVGVLVHEFGHVGVARCFGRKPNVELHTLGGVTTWAGTRGGWLEQLSTSLAGPIVGLLAAATLWLVLRNAGEAGTPALVDLAYRDFLWVSVGWGLVNLAPIRPLDGGQALEAVLGGLGARRPRRIAGLVSVGAGVLLAVIALGSGWVWAGALSGILAYNNAQELRGLPPLRLVT